MKEIGYFVVPEVRRWTKEAYDCWKRNCVCVGCPTGEIMETKCHMKISVIALIRELGLPQKEEEEKWQQEQ